MLRIARRSFFRPVCFVLLALGCQVPVSRHATAQVADAWTAFVATPDNHPNIPNVMHSGYQGGGVAFPSDDGRQIVNVASFGAVGDGTTDDTSAVRAALNFARLTEPNAAVGVTVFFPAGTYRLSGPLLVHSDRTILRGDGRDATTLYFTESLESSYADFDLGFGRSGWSFNGGMVWFTDESRNDYFDGVPTIGGFGDNWRTGGPLTDVTQPASRGDRTISVADGGQYAPGDSVLVQIDNAEDLSTLRHLFGDGAWANAYPFSEARDAKILPGTGRSVYRAVHTVLSSTANTLTLVEPLRFDLRPEWEPEIRTPLDMRRQVGVASLTIQMERDYDWERELNHNAEPGFNGVCFSNTIDGFASNIRIIDPGGVAAMLSYSARITLSDVLVEATAQDRERHHHAFVVANTYNSLVEDFDVHTRPFHGLYLGNTSMGNVYSRGVMHAGTFDYHRILPYENVHTEIAIVNDGVASGSSTSGPRTGARSVHWNVSTRGTGGRIINQPDILPKGALIGVRCSATLELLNQDAGDPEVLLESSGLDGAAVEPANLYEAQLALRDSLSLPGAAPPEPCPCTDEVPYTFEFGGALGSPLDGQDNWRVERDFNDGNGLAAILDLEPGYPGGAVSVAKSVSGQDSVISRQVDNAFRFSPHLHTQSDARVRFDARAGVSGGSSGNVSLILNNFGSFDDGIQMGMSDSQFLIRANRFGSELNQSASIPSGWYSRGEWARLELRIDFTANSGVGHASLFFMNLTDGDTEFRAVPGLQQVPLSDEVRFPESWDRMEFRIRNEAAATNLIPNVNTVGTPCGDGCVSADLNGDQQNTFIDIVQFMSLFDQMNPIADWDGDGVFTFFDTIAYLRDFDEGC
ncbi:MAG: glycosyl hydrolase family 28-related protein [Planctomycetota bacterium]